MRFMDEPEDAEEVVQDVFVKFWKSVTRSLRIPVLKATCFAVYTTLALTT